jgi:hypothetical protein
MTPKTRERIGIVLGVPGTVLLGALYLVHGFDSIWIEIG